MQGDKALALESWCRQQGRQFTRFDYSGHGESDGELVEGSIGQWRADTLAILESVTEGPQLIVGSSMGGWIALLVAMESPRIVGLVGVAAAPDFSRRLYHDRLNDAQRFQLDNEGQVELPSSFPADTPYIISRQLIEEAENHILLDKEIPLDIPVRLLHGQLDDSVPWEVSLEVARRLRGDDVEVQLIKSGDHRLSRDSDISLLKSTLRRQF